MFVPACSADDCSRFTDSVTASDVALIASKALRAPSMRSGPCHLRAQRGGLCLAQDFYRALLHPRADWLPSARFEWSPFIEGPYDGIQTSLPRASPVSSRHASTVPTSRRQS